MALTFTTGHIKH